MIFFIHDNYVRIGVGGDNGMGIGAIVEGPGWGNWVKLKGLFRLDNVG